MNGVYDINESGLEYSDGELSYNGDKKENDENLPDNVRTMNLVKSVANDIDSMIQMTSGVPSNHEDKKVAILDMKV